MPSSRKKIEVDPLERKIVHPPHSTSANRFTRRNGISSTTGTSKISSRHAQEHRNMKYKALKRRFRKIAKLSKRNNRGKRTI